MGNQDHIRVARSCLWSPAESGIQTRQRAPFAGRPRPARRPDRCPVWFPSPCRRDDTCPSATLSKDVAWRAVQPVSPGKERTRFTFDLAGYTPPATASGVLVLLMYNLSAEFAPASPGSGGGSLDELAADIESKRARPQLGRRMIHPAPGRRHGGIGRGCVQEYRQHRPRPGRPAPPGAPERVGSRRPPEDSRLRAASTPAGCSTVHRLARALDSLPGPADASYLRLLDVLEGRRGDQVPEFLILAGDQIYADATAGLFDPRELDDRHRLVLRSILRGTRPPIRAFPAACRDAPGRPRAR